MRLTQAEKSLYGYDKATRTPTDGEIRKEKKKEKNRIEADLVEENPKLEENPEELKEKINEVMR